MLESMPSGLLGANTIAGFGLAYLVRWGILKKFVFRADRIFRASRQFYCEYFCVLVAGVLSVLFNYYFYSVPLAAGTSFYVGFLAFGFFVSIDMALERERETIAWAIKEEDNFSEPKRFYSLINKFFLGSVVTILLVMAIIIMIIARDLAWLSGIELDQMGMMLNMITKTIFKEISFVIATLLVLVIMILYSYSKNLKLLFQLETGVLESVTNGDLSKLVPVATSDEFGVIATNTNKMIHGLRDRLRILAGLNVAKEVQENLLPNQPPKFKDLDISGVSLFCEEVGGDYFDYFTLNDNKIGIAVTDSSGHGVGASLHMTTIRAFLRYGAAEYKTATGLLNSVNRHLTRDSYESGRFTTVFFLEINAADKIMKWIRAGHEPALLYDPVTKKCQKLVGEGMALGVDIDYQFQESEIKGWEKGTILSIFSDGLKETRNEHGEMYGEQRIINILETHADRTAMQIEKALTQDLATFRNHEALLDDITMVTIKFN